MSNVLNHPNRVWAGTLSATLVDAGLRLLATTLDTTETDSGGVHWLVEVAMCLGAVRAVRLLWLFGKVINCGRQGPRR